MIKGLTRRRKYFYMKGERGVYASYSFVNIENRLINSLNLVKKCDYPLFNDGRELMLLTRVPKINFKPFRIALSEIARKGADGVSELDSTNRILSLVKNYNNPRSFLISLEILISEIGGLVNKLRSYDVMQEKIDTELTFKRLMDKFKEDNFFVLDEAKLFDIFTHWQRKLGFFAFSKYAKRVGLLE